MRVTRYRLSYPLEHNQYLLINTLTGALDIVEESVIRYLDAFGKEKNEELSENIIESLKKRGYILEDNKDETDLLNRLLNYYEGQNNLMSFTVCPTYSCNLRCPYCFEDNNVKNQEKVLSRDEIDQIFHCMDVISKKKNMEKKRIQLFGGEPLQEKTKEIVNYILDQAEKNDCSIIIITNGTNLDKFKDILSRHKELITYIQITLDGEKEVHDKTRISKKGVGSFDQIERNIQTMLDFGIPIVTRVNIGKASIKSLKNLFDFYEKKGWTKYKNFVSQLAPITDHCSIGNVTNWMPVNEIIKELNKMFGDFDELKKRYRVILGSDLEKRVKLIRSIWSKENNTSKSIPIVNPCACGAGSRIYYVFGADGKIYACPETVGQEEFAIGTFLPEFTIDEKKDFSWKRNVWNIKKCIDCNIAPLCGSACTWSSIATNGINFIDPVCNYAKETIDDFFHINKQKIIQAICMEKTYD